MRYFTFLLTLFAFVQAQSVELNDSIIIKPGGSGRPGGGGNPFPHKSPNHSSSVCNYDATRMSLIFDLPSSTPASFTIYNCMDEVIYSGVANPEVPYPIEPLHSDNYIIYISQENDTYVCPLFINP